MKEKRIKQIIASVKNGNVGRLKYNSKEVAYAALLGVEDFNTFSKWFEKAGGELPIYVVDFIKSCILADDVKGFYENNFQHFLYFITVLTQSYYENKTKLTYTELKILDEILEKNLLDEQAIPLVHLFYKRSQALREATKGK